MLGANLLRPKVIIWTKCMNFSKNLITAVIVLSGLWAMLNVQHGARLGLSIDGD